MQIDELTEPERVVWEAFPRGEPVDLSGGDQDFDSTNAWGPDRTVRAEVISDLLLGAQDNEPGHVAAVRLTGARITGTLNLGHAHVNVPLALTACQLTDAPHLYWAQLRSVHLMRCRLPGLVASGARIDGHLWLEGSHIYGGVWLDSCHITGILNLTGAHLSHPTGDAPLLADRLIVDNNVYCDQGFTVEGEVRLPGAQVGGQLVFRGARLQNASGVALSLQRLQAEEVLLRPAEPIAGTVDLRYARIKLLRDDPLSWAPRYTLCGTPASSCSVTTRSHGRPATPSTASPTTRSTRR